jgi:S1-C subfamily serine protease
MCAVATEKCKKAIGKVICMDFGQSGSGFFIDSNGTFLTNNHVVTKANLDSTGVITLNYSREIYIRIDGEEHKATMLTAEESDRPYVYDYAILKVDGTFPQHILIGDASTVKQGESVIAMGYPSKFDVPIATSGIISAILPRPSHRNALHTLQTFLTDVLVTYGSSGGPLIREFDGTAIGMVTMPHEIEHTLKHRLNEYILSDSDTISPPIRDLIAYVLTFLKVGYNYAISIDHAISDDVLKSQGGDV